MDRAFVKALRQRIQNVLDESGIEDVKLHLGNCSYQTNHATFKLEVSTIAEDGEVITKEAEDFKAYASLYNLHKEDLGRTFDSNGKTYEIVGAKPRSRKYPILAKDTRSGTVYKFPADTVRIRLSLAS